MKKLILATVASAAVLSLAACGTNNNPVDNVREAASDPALQGTYESECAVKPLQASLSAIFGGIAIVSSKTTYEFRGANVFRNTAMYQAANCEGEVAGTFQEAGSFEILDGAAKTADNGTQIDMKFEKLILKTESDAGAEVAKNTKLCGIDSWAKGQETDVTAQSQDVTCYGAKVPRDLANVYAVQGDKLVLGSTSKDNVESSVRPTSLDTSVSYTKAK